MTATTLTEETVVTHPCAAPGCSKALTPGLFMCARHWAQLPRAVQRDVCRTWRRLSERRTLRAVAEYRAAISAALDALRERTPRGDR